MDKRGISGHVDWILGVGLFLMAIAFIFVFFKPGVTPLYDSDTLLNVLQQGFEKDVNWNITKVPIFLSASKTAQNYINEIIPSKIYLSSQAINPQNGEAVNLPAGEKGHYDQISKIINFDEKGFNKGSFIKTFYVSSGNEGEPNSVSEGDSDIDNFCTTENDDTEEEEENVCEEETSEGDEEKKKKPKKKNVWDAKKKLKDKAKREKQTKFGLKDNNKILIPVKFFEEIKDKKLKYVLLISDKPTNFNSDSFSLEDNEDNKACYAVGEVKAPLSLSGLAEAQPVNPNNPNSPQKAQCPVVYEVGTSETLSGVDLASVLALQENINADELKESWGFPENKDFKIEVEIIGGEKITIGNTEPPANVNVFVRSFNRFILSDDGVNVPIVVRILLW